MHNLIYQQKLNCTMKDMDRYRRIVGQCFLPDSRDIAKAMIAAGVATEYCRYSHRFYGSCCPPSKPSVEQCKPTKITEDNRTDCDFRTSCNQLFLICQCLSWSEGFRGPARDLFKRRAGLSRKIPRLQH
ncbi:MAG: thermonuclease family protein [Rhodobacteraceae bacterium]|nr:thermonuclease family protein [Paracoccaceae bacterium]